ncbi:MAG: TldD/PmbA family protein [Nitrospirota bacterium]|nr:TldD/PmbA family protein [Nitrospirota bacterium]
MSNHILDYPLILKTALRHGGDFADVFVERSVSTLIQLEDNKVEKVITGTDCGAGVRVLFGGKTAYAYGNDLSTDALVRLAETVSAAVKGAAGDVTVNLSKRHPLVVHPVRRHPTDVETTVKVGMVRSANDRARGAGDKVRQVMVVYRDKVSDITIATSDGTLVDDHRVYTTGLVQVIAADGEVLQTGYEPVSGLAGYELFDESPLETAAETAARRALMMLTARKAPGGSMPVVLSADAGGTMIHEAVGHGLEADLALQGLSVYAGKLGQKIASPLITVIDDATLINKRGSFSFDDEGIEAERTVLIEDGILKSYMCDRLWALNGNLKSTGNGRRESYQCRPIPRMTNTFIAPGKSDPAEIVRSTSSGLFVKKMGGGQVNTVTGDFVFEVSEGYMIENGKIGEPVRGATLTGNGPHVLETIDMLGNDLGFSIGTCGKDGQGAPVSDAQPTLRIPEIVVGGHIG